MTESVYAAGLVTDSVLGKTCVQGWGWVLSLIPTTNCTLGAIIIFCLKAIPRGSATLSEVRKGHTALHNLKGKLKAPDSALGRSPGEVAS